MGAPDGQDPSPTAWASAAATSTVPLACDAFPCQLPPPGAALLGPIPRTNRGLMIKRPDRRPGDQASDLVLPGSGGRI